MRTLLGAVGAVAAGSMALDAAFGEGPAAKVEDRSSSLRITALKATPAGPKAYVKIETNHKITGWGEVTGLEPRVACALAQSLFELLDGENPTRIEHLWQKLYRAHRDMRGGPFMVHTLSAIDMALWDITGKVHGVPVYRLLGGPCRDKIRMYPSPKAHKVGTGGPHPFSGNPHDIEPLVRMIEQSRKRVGPTAPSCSTLIVRCRRRCSFSSPPPSSRMTCCSSKSRPCPATSRCSRRLKQQIIKVPLATGERDRTIWEVIPYLQNRLHRHPATRCRPHAAASLS